MVSDAEGPEETPPQRGGSLSPSFGGGRGEVCLEFNHLLFNHYPVSNVESSNLKPYIDVSIVTSLAFKRVLAADSIIVPAVICDFTHTAIVPPMSDTSCGPIISPGP